MMCYRYLLSPWGLQVDLGPDPWTFNIQTYNKIVQKDFDSGLQHGRKSREADCMEMSSRPVPPNDTKPKTLLEGQPVLKYMDQNDVLQISAFTLGVVGGPGSGSMNF